MSSELDLVEVDREASRLAEETWIGEKQARVVVLRRRGLSHAEIARVLDVAEGTSMRHLYDVREEYARRREDLDWLRQRPYVDVVKRDG
jgi:DNA-directed RNA polymerase specialized sigma24 family protein